MKKIKMITGCTKINHNLTKVWLRWINKSVAWRTQITIITGYDWQRYNYSLHPMKHVLSLSKFKCI
jgi:hypothetical protein